MRPKEIIFSILLVIFGFLSGFGWERIPEEPYWVLAIFGFGLFFVFFLLFAVNFWLRWALPVLALLLMSVSLRPSIFVFVGFGLGAVFMLFSLWESEKEYNSSCEFYLRKIAGRSLKIFFTALALVFSLFYYGTLQPENDTVSLLLPREMFKATIEYLEGPVGFLIPGISPGSVVEESLTEEQREQLSRELGVAVEPEETLADVLYKFSLSRISELAQPYGAYIGVLAAASFFFALKLISILFFYAILILSSFLIWLMLKMGVFKKVSVPTTKEMLV